MPHDHAYWPINFLSPYLACSEHPMLIHADFMELIIIATGQKGTL